MQQIEPPNGVVPNSDVDTMHEEKTHINSQSRHQQSLTRKRRVETHTVMALTKFNQNR